MKSRIKILLLCKFFHDLRSSIFIWSTLHSPSNITLDGFISHVRASFVVQDWHTQIWGVLLQDRSYNLLRWDKWSFTMLQSEVLFRMIYHLLLPPYYHYNHMYMCSTWIFWEVVGDHPTWMVEGRVKRDCLVGCNRYCPSKLFVMVAWWRGWSYHEWGTQGFYGCGWSPMCQQGRGKRIAHIVPQRCWKFRQELVWIQASRLSEKDTSVVEGMPMAIQMVWGIFWR